MNRVLVIGAGIGGLTTAAALARAGLPVTVLEAHVYPGGCAGTFYHQRYRFDAGATLAAGFYPGGPMDKVAQAAGINTWPTQPVNTAMLVHLPDGAKIPLLGGEARWGVRQTAFGPAGEAFWRWQEYTSDALWDLALELPDWPPQSPAQLLPLLRKGIHWLGGAPRQRLSAGLLLDAFRPVAAHLTGVPDRLRLFVDAQLLISAQTTCQHTNALYGASALDLARRGVVNLEGGMGSIAQSLVQAIQRNGGQVLFRQQAARIVFERNRPVAVETRRGESFPAELVVANLPPWNILALAGENAPAKLKNLPQRPKDGWGAFMLYAGVDGSIFPNDYPLHHQVVLREPLGEGNSIYISASPDWDDRRAPAGKRAVTISTHTALGPWWELFENDQSAYEARKAEYVSRVLSAAEIALPGIRQAARLVLPGTPVTFQRFTHRAHGWVGGFPQTSLLRNWGPRLAPGLWMVGDSIFPGQSTAAVALGGLRVAQSVLREPQRQPVAAHHWASEPVSLERNGPYWI